MPTKNHFIEKGILQNDIDEYFRSKLARAGYSNLEIFKTPLGTRVIINAERPGMIIGRRGRSVKELTIDLEQRFNLENPQIEVNQIDVPELDAKVMVQRIASGLARGIHFRRAGYSVLRLVMKAGARGVEITIKGKITSQRARTEKFREGFVAKCGEPALLYVDQATTHVPRKSGVLGVTVKIMLPQGVLPDEVEFIPGTKPDEKEIVESPIDELIEEEPENKESDSDEEVSD
ncbi:30S ribosomal protein S3 [Candidatus Borrarchaeum sp.]|uniref:30S ribosomal protein S3 n=1 Tax=Candidatus Borrarchaeum sp. TaxID=2846742 RepID=UPI00257C5C5D|nr:30S ribosomal protein S3 [Candidatus Borrarchaeum sp.]